jgi:hypothetical protein
MDPGAIFNETFSGLALYYRDTVLTEKLLSRYFVGQILMERGFTDASYKGGGLIGTSRYLIASASATNLSDFNSEAANNGHMLISTGSYFKVLDIFSIGNKTQILLLHIPSHTVDFFQANTSNVESEIVQKARQNFEQKINSAVVGALQLNSWKDRVSSPLGMNSDGELFYKHEKQDMKTAGSSAKKNKEKQKDNTGKKTKPWWKFW